MELDKFEEFLSQGNMAKNTILAYLYAVKEFGSRHKDDIYTKGGKIRRIYIPKTLRTETEKWCTLTRSAIVMPRISWRSSTTLPCLQTLWGMKASKRHVSICEEVAWSNKK